MLPEIHLFFNEFTGIHEQVRIHIHKCAGDVHRVQRAFLAGHDVPGVSGHEFAEDLLGTLGDLHHVAGELEGVVAGGVEFAGMANTTVARKE